MEKNRHFETNARIETNTKVEDNNKIDEGPSKSMVSLSDLLSEALKKSMLTSETNNTHETTVDEIVATKNEYENVNYIIRKYLPSSKSSKTDGEMKKANKRQMKSHIKDITREMKLTINKYTVSV